jgi:CheY-like chemotaxis protein
MILKPTILCVDDRMENLLIRKRMLEVFGCVVMTSPDSSSCLTALNENRVDLVIIDYHLDKEMNGAELAREIRNTRPKLPLIMLTGDPNIPDSARETVDAVLIKGASNPRDMLDLIQELVPDANLKPRTPQILPGTNQKAS